MKYPIHHVQVTVPDVEKAEAFYDQLFELLGYDISQKFKGYLEHADMQVIEYLGENFDFGICSPKKEYLQEQVDTRKPGALQHLAFFAESRAAVDTFYQGLKQTEAKILHDEPREYKEKIAPHYYAVFFESPDGLHFEVFHYPE